MAELLKTHVFLTITMKVLLIFLSLSFSSYSQMVLNDSEHLNDDVIVFNPEFIRSRGISIIKGRVSVKKPSATIKLTNDYRAFFFDTLGRITTSFETTRSYDTLWREYIYNGKGFLIYQSFGTRARFNYTTYNYDEMGRLVGVEEFQRENDFMGIPKTNLFKKRTFEYQDCDTTCRKTIKSDKGTPFMKEEMFPLLNGKPKRIEKRYLATNEGTIEYFDYSPYGQIVERNTLSTREKLQKERYSFRYDDLGNVKERKYFDEGALRMETQYIINENTGLLSALIEETDEKTFLTITQFRTYEYYD